MTEPAELIGKLAELGNWPEPAELINMLAELDVRPGANLGWV